MTTVRSRISRLAARVGIDRLDVLLFLAFVVIAGSWVNEVTAQPASRYLLTAAIVEEHTVQLDAYAPALGVDRIRSDDGHVYSDKAPLQSLLGVPVLALAETLGVPQASAYEDAPSIAEWAEGNVGAWTQTFTFAVLPGAALILLMRRHVGRYVDDRTATVAALAIACSTMVLLFSVFLYAHVLVAFIALLAWHIVSSERLTPWWKIAAGGVLIAFGFAIEYPVLGAGGVIGLWVWKQHGFLRAFVFGLPSAVVLAGIIAWNRMVYGSLQTSYSQKGSDLSTVEYLSPPKLYNTFEIFFGRKGFIFTPIVLLAVVGLGVAIWQRRTAIAVPSGVFLFVYLLQAGWGNPWGGETANPRYMLLALPFLAYPLAIMRQRVSAVFFRTLAAIGFVSMGLAAVTLELIPDGHALIGTNLRYLFEGQTGTTVWALAFGPLGWVVYAALGSAVFVATAHTFRSMAVDIGPADATLPSSPLMPAPHLGVSP